MIIQVKFLGGTNIEDAIKEAQRLSSLLQCGIEVNFNGYVFIYWPNIGTGKYLSDYKLFCVGGL